jgi:hypothetical protein
MNDAKKRHSCRLPHTHPVARFPRKEGRKGGGGDDVYLYPRSVSLSFASLPACNIYRSYCIVRACVRVSPITPRSPSRILVSSSVPASPRCVAPKIKMQRNENVAALLQMCTRRYGLVIVDIIHAIDVSPPPCYSCQVAPPRPTGRIGIMSTPGHSLRIDRVG